MNNRKRKVLEKVTPRIKVFYKNDGGFRRYETNLNMVKSNIPTITYYNWK